MIHIFRADQAHANKTLFEDMFRLRHRVFKELLGWDVRSEGGLERDEFDDLGPIYFISETRDGHVNAALRFLPTTGPYMLRDVFAELIADHEIPSSPGLWEASRLVVDCPADGAAGLQAMSQTTSELLCALGEFGVPYGIREVITVYDIRVDRLVRRCGVPPHWTGKRCRIGNSIALAARFEISPHTLEIVRQTANIRGSVVVDHVSDAAREAA